MGDVAQILSGEAAKAATTSTCSTGPSAAAAASSSGRAQYPPPPPPPPPRSSRPGAAAPYGLSRDVLEILTDPKLRRGDIHAAPLPPMVPSLGFAAARYASAVSGRKIDGVTEVRAKKVAGKDGDGDVIMVREGDDGDGDGDGEGDGGGGGGGGVEEGEKSKADAKASQDDQPKPEAAAATAGPPPTIPRTVKVGNRTISSAKPARRWVWDKFSSSARTDGAQFQHWVRSGVEYPDYPYARFDVHLDPVSYTDQEYEKYMKSDDGRPSGLVVHKPPAPRVPDGEAVDDENDDDRRPSRRWTRQETDRLLEFARAFELRWAVVHDRWVCHYGKDHRTVEELMHRYYSVGARLTRLRVQQAATAEAQAAQAALRGIQQQQQAAAQAAQQGGIVGPDGSVRHPPPPPTTSSDGRTTEELIADRTVAAAIARGDPRYQPTILSGGTGTSNKDTFDLDAERERRRQLDLLWFRSKEEEQEEEELRAELRLVEAQLRKLKKSGGHVLAGQAAAGGGAAAASGARSTTPVPGVNVDGSVDTKMLDEAFASTAPVPKSGTPYLQSGRLEHPASGGPSGLNKSLLKRMEVVMKELNVPDDPLPTKRVCDMYDSVRKDTVTLITLQKICLKREQEVQGRRARLAKLGGALAAMRAAEKAKAKAKAKKASAASASAAAAAAGSKSAPAAGASSKSAAEGGDKKKSTSGSKSKSKSKSKSDKFKSDKSKSDKFKSDKSKSDKSKSKDSSGKSDEKASGDGTETKKKTTKKKKKKKASDDGDDAKPKKKAKKSSST